MAAMGLSRAVLDVLMTLRCPACGFELTRKGSWFKSAYRYSCENCGTENQVTYDDKIRLFKHAEALKKGLR